MRAGEDWRTFKRKWGSLCLGGVPACPVISWPGDENHVAARQFLPVGLHLGPLQYFEEKNKKKRKRRWRAEEQDENDLCNLKERDKHCTNNVCWQEVKEKPPRGKKGDFSRLQRGDPLKTNRKGFLC